MCKDCNFRKYEDDILKELVSNKKYAWAINAIEEIQDYVKENGHIEREQKEFIKRVIDTSKQMEINKERGE